MDKARNECGEFINTLPRYREYNGDTYLELHANRTLWKIDKDLNEDELYCELEGAIEMFESITGECLFMLGRSGRHICIADTKKNSKRFQYLRKIALKLEQDFITRLND